MGNSLETCCADAEGRHDGRESNRSSYVRKMKTIAAEKYILERP